MKFGSDNDSLIFYPETEFECFVFGKVVERHDISHSIRSSSGKIENFEINGKDLWNYLVLPRKDD